jgi:hypothetical protein
VRADQLALNLAGVVFLSAVAVMLPHRASADEYWPLFQITCIPDLNYFSIRNFGIANTPSEFIWGYPDEKDAVHTREESLAHKDQQLRLLETAYGIYTAERLQKQPYECLTRAGKEVAGQPLKVRVAGKYVAPSAEHCQGAGIHVAHVTINDRDIGSLSVGNGCPETTETIIQARDEGVGPTIQRCDFVFPSLGFSTDAPDSVPRPVHTTCQEWRPDQKSN